MHVMFWSKRHPLLALGALALALRISCAVVTEYNPLFPAYYYTDANLFHAAAERALGDMRAGRATTIRGTLGERLQTLMTIQVYRALGPRPFAVKLFNALLGALGVATLTWTLSLVFPFQTALAVGILVAIWPSHIFYTSQNLKEAPVLLLAFAALGAALAAGLESRAASIKERGAFAFGAALAMLAVGFYRPYIPICLTAALLLTHGLAACARASRTNALATATVLIATMAIFPTVSNRILAVFDSASPDSPDHNEIQARLIPSTYEKSDPSKINRPTSPPGISRFRTIRQSEDRRWAKSQSIYNREIGTQIYPDAEFKTWNDVFAYLPKGAFTVLFMPLPGLYPMAGKLGRWAAAGENIVLLAISVFAALGFARGPITPARLGLLAFFAMMTTGAALLEFDLGSAGRHKILYLPMLFPFAAEEALRPRRGKKPA